MATFCCTSIHINTNNSGGANTGVAVDGFMTPKTQSQKRLRGRLQVFA
jgi:hypothetical protein